MIKKILLFFSAILLFIFLKENGFYSWLQLKQINNTLRTKIQTQLNEVKILDQEIDSLTNNMEYIKKIAEDRYGLVKPGERLITIIDTSYTQ